MAPAADASSAAVSGVGAARSRHARAGGAGVDASGVAARAELSPARLAANTARVTDGPLFRISSYLLNIARFCLGLKALNGGYDKYAMSNTHDAACIPSDAAGWGRKQARIAACMCVSLVFGQAVACSKTREQPELSVKPAPVSNSLRAPTFDPKAKKGKVNLPSRQWGTQSANTGGSKIKLAEQTKSLNEDANGLKRDQLQKALDEKLGGLAKCFDNTDVTSAGIFFEADPSGEARAISVRGAPAEAEACAKGIIGSLRFPEFHGNPVPIDFPISISRRVETAPKPAGGADEAAAK